MTLPTDQDLLAMDGPALTRVAWEFGLAPPGALTLPHGMMTPCGGWDGGVRWTPDTHIAQANALLRLLRTQGFLTSVSAGADCGRVAVTSRGRSVPPEGPPLPRETECRWGIGEPGAPAEPRECLALLRCACLAVVRQLREEQR